MFDLTQIKVQKDDCLEHIAKTYHHNHMTCWTGKWAFTCSWNEIKNRALNFVTMIEEIQTHWHGNYSSIDLVLWKVKTSAQKETQREREVGVGGKGKSHVIV